MYTWMERTKKGQLPQRRPTATAPRGSNPPRDNEKYESAEQP